MLLPRDRKRDVFYNKYNMLKTLHTIHYFISTRLICFFVVLFVLIPNHTYGCVRSKVILVSCEFFLKFLFLDSLIFRVGFFFHCLLELLVDSYLKSVVVCY